MSYGCALRWLFAGFISLAVAAPADADKIRIRADEWLPYNGGSTLKPPGYMIEMAEAIAKANGHEIDYRTMPWEQALEVVRKGKADCVVGAYLSDAEGFAFPKRGWGKAGTVFFAMADSKWKYDGVASLDLVRIGVAEGYSYGDEIDAYIEQYKADTNRMEVVPVVGRAIVRLIARLIGGRVNVVIEDANVMAYAVEQAKIEPGRIVPVGQAGELEFVHIACTPADPRGQVYADMFDAGTDQLRASGKLAEILGRYNLKDWEGAEK